MFKHLIVAQESLIFSTEKEKLAKYIEDCTKRLAKTIAIIDEIEELIKGKKPNIIKFNELDARKNPAGFYVHGDALLKGFHEISKLPQVVKMYLDDEDDEEIYEKVSKLLTMFEDDYTIYEKTHGSEAKHESFVVHSEADLKYKSLHYTSSFPVEIIKMKSILKDTFSHLLPMKNAVLEQVKPGFYGEQIVRLYESTLDIAATGYDFSISVAKDIAKHCYE
jgi:hypothetical protein